jgi:RNA polymerase sigma-70 factor (ECF subfamily)
LNRAAAVAMAHGYEAGLSLMDDLEQRGELHSYFLLPAARADLLRRLERWPEAADAYRAALALVVPDSERRFLLRRLAEVDLS